MPSSAFRPPPGGCSVRSSGTSLAASRPTERRGRRSLRLLHRGDGKQKIPDNCLSRTKKFPRCHLASRFDPCPLRSACTLPGLDGALPSRDTRCLSRAPSAVHLMHCIPPGSQPPGLSVGSCRTVISASTVFIWLSLLYHTGRTFVNRENAFLYTRPFGSQKGRERRKTVPCHLSRISMCLFVEAALPQLDDGHHGDGEHQHAHQADEPQTHDHGHQGS